MVLLMPVKNIYPQYLFPESGAGPLFRKKGESGENLEDVCGKPVKSCAL
jgi:hypothetical protein